MARCWASGCLLPGAAKVAANARGNPELLVGSANTVSGLCPFAGQAGYVSPAQCGAYDA